MKKILAATLAVIMTAAVMTSCGDNESSSKTESKAEASSSVEVSSKAEESKNEQNSNTSIAKALNNQENASLKFTKGMDTAEFCSRMNSDDGEAQVEFSIEELDGVPMLKIKVLDKTDAGNWKTPKIQLNMAKFFAGQESELPKIFTVKMDAIYKAAGAFHDEETGEDKMVPGNFLGKVVTQPSDGNGSNSWNELLEYSFAEWENEWGYAELQIRPGIKEQAKYKDVTTDQYLSLMRWEQPNEADIYIANITFLDEDGNVIPCNYGK